MFIYLRNILEPRTLLLICRFKLVLVNQFILRVNPSVLWLLRHGELIKNSPVTIVRDCHRPASISLEQPTKTRQMKTSTRTWMNVFVLRWLSTFWIARENSRDFDSVMKVHTQNMSCAVRNQCSLVFSSCVSSKEDHSGHCVFWLTFVYSVVTMEITLTEICV